MHASWLSESTDDRRVIAIWASWMALAAWVTSRHEMWFDELQAWTIARESHSFADLLHNLRWEGHPPLWYVVLWPVTRLSDSPHAMQLLNLAVCGIAALLLLRHLRLPLFLRTAVVFGYYPLYELGAISRGYGLMCLLGVTAAVLGRRTERPSPVVTATVILLMAMTEVVAIPLALAFVVGLWVVPWWQSRDRNPRTGIFLGVTATVIAGAALVARPSPGGRAPRNLHAPTLDSLDRAASAIGKALIPIPDLTMRFWNTSLLGSVNGAIPWIAGVVVFASITRVVRRSPIALALWLIGVGGYGVLAMSTWKAVHLRHSSVVWLALMMILILSESPSRTSMKVNRGPGLALVAAFVAGAGIVGSAVAVVQETRHRFSGAHEAALWLEERETSEFVVLCATDMWVCTSVSMRLHVDAYQRANDAPLTFAVFKRGWSYSSTDPGTAFEEAAALRRRVRRHVAVITGRDVFLEGCVAQSAFTRVVMEPVTVCIPPETRATEG